MSLQYLWQQRTFLNHQELSGKSSLVDLREVESRLEEQQDLEPEIKTGRYRARKGNRMNWGLDCCHKGRVKKTKWNFPLLSPDTPFPIKVENLYVFFLKLDHFGAIHSASQRKIYFEMG